MMRYAGILIKRKDGKMLFQLRDNNPFIQNKNQWGIFGGGIKSNETPIAGAMRELKEELSFNVQKNELRLLAVFPGLKQRNYVYAMDLNQNAKDLQLQEGAALGYFTISEMVRKKNVVKTVKLLLICYPFLCFVRKMFVSLSR
ncbi:MAG: NUDIX domain-containing protein [Nanoarchaeota archaeon]